MSVSNGTVGRAGRFRPVRRQALLAYFGEASERCGTCDLCREGAAGYDATTEAQKVLSAAVRTGERFGGAHLADVLSGEATDTIRRHGHDNLKTFGAGKEHSKRQWQTIVRQLHAAGALEEASSEHGGFRLTERGVAILRGHEPVTLRVVSETRTPRRERGVRPVAADLDKATADLFEHLRSVRLEIARKEGIAAYMVFADRSLIDMARLKPRTRDDMKLVHGVGEAKLARYGAVFLKAVAGFAA